MIKIKIKFFYHHKIKQKVNKMTIKLIIKALKIPNKISLYNKINNNNFNSSNNNNYSYNNNNNNKILI